MAKYLRTKEIGWGHQTWSSLVSTYGNMAFEMFPRNCMNLVQWFARSNQTPPPPKRKREEETDLQAAKKQMLTQLNEMIEGCQNLAEFRRKMDSLNSFPPKVSDKRFLTHIMKQNKNDLTVTVHEQNDSFTLIIGDLERDLFPKICQIKETLFYLPCGVNNIVIQALCDSGAGLDVVSKKILNKIVLKMRRPYYGGTVTMVNNDPIRPQKEVLLEIEIAGSKRRHWFTVMNELSSDIIFGDLFLRKIEAVLDFSERTIEIRNLTKESMIFSLSDNETRTRLSALIPQPGELGELKTFQQITFPP